MVKKLALPLFISLGLIACSEDQALVVEEKLRPVATMVIHENNQQFTRNFSGVAKAATQSRLSFRVAGKVEKLDIQVGQKLSKDQTVATLNTEDFNLELEKADAALTQAKVEASNASTQYQRIKQLFNKGSASRTEIDNAKTSMEAAKAKVNQSLTQKELAAQKLAYTELKTQLDQCTVASVDIEVGENVSVGATVATVNCGKTTNVEVAIPETYISAIKQGEQVSITFNALTDQVFTGIVAEVGVEATGTAYSVTIQLEGPSSLVLPGMAAFVSFPDSNYAGKDILVLPLHVVQSDSDGKFVYQIMPESKNEATLKRTAIETGDFGGKGVIVTSGVSKGDIIATKGLRYLYDGMRVRYQSSATQGE